MRRVALLISVLALAVAGGCGDDDDGGGGGSSATTPPTTTASEAPAASTGGANTAQVVQKAKAFLRTLSDEQRTKVVQEAGSEDVQQSWSNLPAALSPRLGVYLGELDSEQRAAALAMMKTALSEQGYRQLEALRAADDFLGEQGSGGGAGGGGAPPGGGPPPGGLGGGGSSSLEGTSTGGDAEYSGGNYFIVMYGEPSDTDRWLLQYTGHHLTFNIGYEGETVSFGPEFSGAEPISYESDGKTITPLADQGDAFRDIIANLGGKADAATLDGSFDDLLLGAQKDGPFPDPAEGVKVSELPRKAQDAVEKVIRAYVGDLGGDAADAKVQAYLDALDETAFGYAGETDDKAQGFYARLDGPVLWIEISTQRAIVVDGTHYHSIYREQGSDYGG